MFNARPLTGLTCHTKIEFSAPVWHDNKIGISLEASCFANVFQLLEASKILPTADTKLADSALGDADSARVWADRTSLIGCSFDTAGNEANLLFCQEI